MSNSITAWRGACDALRSALNKAEQEKRDLLKAGERDRRNHDELARSHDALLAALVRIERDSHLGEHRHRTGCFHFGDIAREALAKAEGRS